MRNVTFTLTADQADRAAFYAEVMAGHVGDESGSVVSFLYTPREGGEATERTGQVLALVGTPGTSTHAVKVLTDKGPRTFNLYLIG